MVLQQITQSHIFWRCCRPIIIRHSSVKHWKGEGHWLPYAGFVPRVAKGRNIFGNFPWELRLGNFVNKPSFKLTRNYMGIFGKLWELFGKCIKLSYINTFFDHRLTCMQNYTHLRKLHFWIIWRGICDVFFRIY